MQRVNLYNISTFTKMFQLWLIVGLFLESLITNFIFIAFSVNLLPISNSIWQCPTQLELRSSTNLKILALQMELSCFCGTPGSLIFLVPHDKRSRNNYKASRLYAAKAGAPSIYQEQYLCGWARCSVAGQPSRYAVYR